jgi:hypothetical protein
MSGKTLEGNKIAPKHPILTKDTEKQDTVTGEAFHSMSWMQKNDLLMADEERRWRVKNPEADMKELTMPKPLPYSL